MNALLAFLLSVGASLLSFTLIMVWYIVPRLSKQPRMQALLPLVLLHTFRTAGLVVLLPQVIGGVLPLGFAAPAAYGDLLTAGLAGLSAFMLRLQPGLALPFVWLFNLVGIIVVPAACCAIHTGRERKRSSVERGRFCFSRAM